MMRFLNNNTFQTDIFNRPLGDLLSAILREEELTTASFTPPVGSAWSGDALNLRFVMPGVSEKDFTLTARGDTLVLTGFRVPPAAFDIEGDVKHALTYGRFERLMPLPPGADIKHMEAKFHHGVLDVKVPMRDEFKPRTIPVETEELVAATA